MLLDFNSHLVLVVFFNRDIINIQIVLVSGARYNDSIVVYIAK